MNNFNIETCKYDFSSDSVDIIALVYDYSGSMDSYERAMLEANQAFKADFSKFEEKGSIAIAKGRFNSGFDMTSFAGVSQFDTSYYANGGTALYSAIVQSAKNTIQYYNEIVKRLNIQPKITFLVFSDGDDNESESYYESARQAMTELNSLDATTVFVAFGEATHTEIGSKLKFSCTKNIDTVEELVRCMGKELSKSCKEQSKSAYSLKSAFFSIVDNSAEEDDTQNQAIKEDDFFAGI